LFPCREYLLMKNCQDLTSRFSKTDPKVNVGVLEVAHSIFARWRPLFRTNELYIEINHVVKTFGEAFVKLLIVSCVLRTAIQPVLTRPLDDRPANHCKCRQQGGLAGVV
jgi:hypothetical protein